MKTISLKLPDDIDAKLELRASTLGMTKSAITREALSRHLDQTRAGSSGVFEMLVRKVVTLSFHLGEQLAEVQRLRAKYSDVPMSVADASLVRMAEHFSRSAVLTLDGDFRVYRRHGRYVIPLILPGDMRRP